ncbi:cubilin-like [Branchiostoma floridae x Branchiostoma japonicum]
MVEVPRRRLISNVLCFLVFLFPSDLLISSANGCGGNLTAPSGGPVTSPNYPGNYGNNETCDWLITVPTASRIRLTFDSFNLQNGSDFLAVYDGGNVSASQLQSLTGSQTVNPITSTSNVMFLRFTSDGSGTAQGFQFSYTNTTAVPVPTTAPGCGGILTAPPGGTVTSPNYPDVYNNGENCNWLITAPEGSRIRLTFDSFDVEYGYDVLNIYDVANAAASLLRSLTGSLSVSPIISASNVMFLRFTSDYSGTAQGFQFSFTTNFTICGGNLMAASGGPFTSPNYPGHYGNNETCEWLITVPTGSRLRLTFDSFDVQNGFDFLNIYDGANVRASLLRSLTGSRSVSPIVSTSNVMFLRFTSDGSVTAQGFQFFTSNISLCGGNLTAASGGPVTSPNYPGDYYNDETCEWLITAPEGSRIRLTFDSFEVQNHYDFLTIYDGANVRASLLRRLTGSQSISPIVSTSNVMFLRFTSDGSVTAQGFQFFTSNISLCGGNLTAASGGPVTSPNYPGDYHNDETCEWLITAPEGSRIRLTFDSFEVENHHDSLNIYDGANVRASLLRSLTGSLSVSPIVSTSNVMFLRFTSDGSVTAQGFQFFTSNISLCGGNLTAASGGPVTSPNYPGDYYNDETCEWLITAPEGSRIRLTFDSFEVQNRYDFLTIYDGANVRASLFRSLTGSRSVSPIVSTSNVMFLRFTSDGSVTAQGFQFFTSNISLCGGNLTAASGGPVTSPNYPGDYYNDETCEWLITAPEGSRIRLTFDSFEVQNRYDFLTIYDGANVRASLFRR